MAYYWTCPFCGANLDPGERCDCDWQALVEASQPVCYGYARISKAKQNIDRQIRNILTVDPAAIIVKEAYTGTTTNRKEWNKLYTTVKAGDTIIFDSVSRMSRNADEGIAAYEELYNRGVHLVFIKEPFVSSIIDPDRNRVRLAFEQAEKEVQDLRQRTKEGIETARMNGKQIGLAKGTTLTTKKSVAAKELIRKHSTAFGGSLDDAEMMQLAGLARNTYYKYKRELKESVGGST